MNLEVIDPPRHATYVLTLTEEEALSLRVAECYYPRSSNEPLIQRGHRVLKEIDHLLDVAGCRYDPKELGETNDY